MKILRYCYNFNLSTPHNREIAKGDITVLPHFRSLPMGLRLLRNYYNRHQLPFHQHLFNIPKDINTYDMVIIADDTPQNFIPVLESEITNKDCKLIYYFVNTINDSPEKLSDRWEIWSFDKNDCIKYGVKYNPAPYCKMEIPPQNILYDAVFVGLNKGREALLGMLSDSMEKQGLIPFFKIVENKEQRLSYEEVLLLNAQSRSIVEVLQNGQTGVTLRTMESLFYHQKLITNNKNIKQYKIYNAYNIFVLGEDDMADLTGFLSTPYQQAESHLENLYTFDMWAERFYQGIEPEDI